MSIQELEIEADVVTDKDVIYCANTDEDVSDNAHVAALKAHAAKQGREVIVMAARMEEELTDVAAGERKEFLDACGLDERALDRLIHAGYRALGLVSFFTIQSNQVQAWTVRGGTKAPQAAGTIHTDFEKGFIRAEVVACDAFVEHGCEAECRAHGALRTEGKDYVVQDGDIIRFLFSA